MRMLVYDEALDPSRADVKAERSLREAIQEYERAKGDVTEQNHFDWKPITPLRMHDVSLSSCAHSFSFSRVKNSFAGGWKPLRWRNACRSVL
jgi:hypothetical protein